LGEKSAGGASTGAASDDNDVVIHRVKIMTRSNASAKGDYLLVAKPMLQRV
jgi:hypothetical protein